MAGTLDVPTMRILMESGTDWWMFSATVGTALLGAWALYTAAMRAAKEQFGSTMAHLVGQEKAQERQHRHQLKVMRAAEEWKRTLDALQEVFGAISNLFDLARNGPAFDDADVKEFDRARRDCRELVNHHRLYLPHSFGSSWEEAQGPLARMVERNPAAYELVITKLTDCRASLALEKWSEEEEEK